MFCHHRLILSTANSAVSWSIPSTPEAAVVHQVINAVRHGFPISYGEIIIHIDSCLLSLGLPFPPAVLEISDQLFLLTIDGDDWLPFSCKGFASAIDVLKLAIPVCMRRPKLDAATRQRRG